MPETRRLVEAVNALSRNLREHGIAHAFYGGAMVSLLANASQADVMSTLINADTRLMLITPLSGSFLYRLKTIVRSVLYLH